MNAGEAADAMFAEFTNVDANSVAIALIICFRHPEWARALYEALGTEAENRDWSAVYDLLDAFIATHPIIEKVPA